MYTPSRNIVYHDYSPNPNGMDWNKPRGRKMRLTSLERIKSFLHIDGAGRSKTDLANLGIYGLGKRRSLAQLMDFVGIDSNTMKFDTEVRTRKGGTCNAMCRLYFLLVPSVLTRDTCVCLLMCVL